MNESVVKSFTLDAVDLRILAELQRDAGQSNQDLAARVHVSPATCLRRVRHLTTAGVIDRRVALLDPRALGSPLEVICEVTMDRQGDERVSEYESMAASHPAVRQCYRVSPGPDVVLIAAARDMPHWATIAAELFTQQANVRSVKTFFVVKRVRYDTAWPLPNAQQSR